MPRITLTAVNVDDQEKALRFYVDVLGFRPKTDIPLGPEMRWLTVVSADDPDGVELLLEPSDHPAVGPFKDALVADGIPATSFGVDDVHGEFERLRALGVRFTQEPVAMGDVTVTVLDDTCGNLTSSRRPADPGRPVVAGTRSPATDLSFGFRTASGEQRTWFLRQVTEQRLNVTPGRASRARRGCPRDRPPPPLRPAPAGSTAGRRRSRPWTPRQRATPPRRRP